MTTVNAKKVLIQAALPSQPPSALRGAEATTRAATYRTTVGGLLTGYPLPARGQALGLRQGPGDTRALLAYYRLLWAEEDAP